MQNTSVSVADKIASYEFSSIVAHALKENPELVQTLSAVVEDYKSFIRLIVECPNANLAVPSKAVDALWHSHILHTRNYAQFCRLLGVDFIHHSPHSATTSQAEKATSRQNLIDASVKVFGSNVFTITNETSEEDCNACKGECNVPVTDD